MLLKTTILALAAAVALAAPVDPAQNTTKDAVQVARDIRGGVSIRCFRRTGHMDTPGNCQGDQNPYNFGGDHYGMQPGDTLQYAFVWRGFAELSCRFDTWDDWKGEFEIGWYDEYGNPPWSSGDGWNPFAPKGYSSGSGQVCVNAVYSKSKLESLSPITINVVARRY
ncbi:hypothetical protein Q8F55_007388 [Vanrija albida]|uniref:Store-operated calcium entry-associated regulatory factor n=1 Tax=Vanrija albida TaxID=181172 RepID=A0ABR3PTF0_9TREE